MFYAGGSASGAPASISGTKVELGEFGENIFS